MATPLSREPAQCSRSTECASSDLSSFVAVTSAICLPLSSWMAPIACSCLSDSAQLRLPAYSSHCSLLRRAAKQPVLCCFLLQKWREKQRAKQQEMEDRLQQLTQQLQNVMAEKAFVEGRNSILQSELLRRNSPDSPLGPISSGQGTGCLLGSGLQQAAVATASRQGSGLQRDSAAGRSGGLSMASSEELSGQVGTCIRLNSMADRLANMWFGRSVKPAAAVGVQHCELPGQSPGTWAWMHWWMC